MCVSNSTHPLLEGKIARKTGSADQHKTDFFFDAHLSDQIVYPNIDRQTPVFVFVEFAVFIQVFEFQAALFKGFDCAEA